MFRNCPFQVHIIALLLLCVAGVLLATVFPQAGARSAEANKPTGVSSRALASGSDSSASFASTTCTIGDVSVFEDRIHVRCTNSTTVGANYVYYFAFPTDSLHAATANRFLVLLNTAYALNKQISIRFYSDSASNPVNCNVSDCRQITWLTTLP